MDVLEQYRSKTGDDVPTLVVSTASPFKFCPAVMEGLGEKAPQQGLKGIEQLSQLTGIPAPAPLAGLAGKAVRFTGVTEKENMPQKVREMLL